MQNKELIYAGIIGLVILVVTSAAVLFTFAPDHNDEPEKLRALFDSDEAVIASAAAVDTTSITSSANILGPTAFSFGNDQVLNAAVVEARQTQNKFEAAFQAGRGGRYSFKAVLSDGSKTEAVWLQLDRIQDGDYLGRIAATSTELPKVTDNQALRVSRSEIVDWMIQREDGIFGAYTTRVILKRSGESQASNYLSLIKDL